MKTSDLDGFLMVKIEQVGYKKYRGVVMTKPGAKPMLKYVGESQSDVADRLFGALKALGVRAGHKPEPAPVLPPPQLVAMPRHREFEAAYKADYEQSGRRLEKGLFYKRQNGSYKNKRIQAAWWGWFCGMEKAAAGGVA